MRNLSKSVLLIASSLTVCPHLFGSSDFETYAYECAKSAVSSAKVKIAESEYQKYSLEDLDVKITKDSNESTIFRFSYRTKNEDETKFLISKVGYKLDNQQQCTVTRKPTVELD